MRILMTGASGFIGQSLLADLRRRNREVQVLPRTSKSEYRWDPDRGELDISVLEGVDAVINLSGANIAGRRWTPTTKEALRSSRLLSTALLAERMAQMRRPPRILINASAVGYYGDRGDELLEDDSPPGGGFLAKLVEDWEGATAEASRAGIRVVCLRLGIVLGKGGVLEKLLLPFRLGLGGPVGSGRQFWPWIATEDVCGVVDFVLEHDELAQPLNLAAPESSRNRDFVRSLGRALHRPAILPVPAIALRILMGEMAEPLLLSSARVRPTALLESGYSYLAPTLDQAFALSLA